MNGGSSTIVEFWRDEDSGTQRAPQEEDVLLLRQAVLDIEETDDERADGLRRSRALPILLVLVGIGWLGFAGWAMVRGDAWNAGPATWPGLIASLIVPLVMLGVAYLLVSRNSRSEARRYLDTARALRTESDLLELRLGRIADQLEAARQTMQDQAALLESYGAAASSNMEASAELIAARALSTAASAETAERAGSALIARMDLLVAAMPEFEERAGKMAATIEDNGHSLAARIDTLEARLHSLTELSDDARTRTLSATKSLASQLSTLQEATRAAVDEVNGISDVAGARIGATLQHMLTALDTGRHALETQAQSLDTLVARAQTGLAETSRRTVTAFATDIDQVQGALEDRMATALSGARENLAFTDASLTQQADTLEALIARSRESISAIGGETVAGLASDMSEVEGRLHQLNDLVEGQRTLMGGLNATLVEAIETAESRFAALETSAMARSGRLTDALARMTAETGRIDTALASGGVTAEKLIGYAEGLLVALDSSVRELDETYPAALDRFDARLASSRALLDSATPEMEHLEAISEALVGRAQEAEEMLRGQGRRLTEWLESTQSGLDANRALVDQLRDALDGAHQDATRITEGAGPLLITALLRVKDTADQAAERARQALGRAIPDAAQALAEASEHAMEAAIGNTVTQRIEQVAQVAEEAVKAAHMASDRLMRQLLTIAETSASVEQRIEQAERAAEDRDRDHFARRSALLIESLNSTAIDVAKILSNDVTDSAWSSYLKGDRGVFTRRAVKLLDAGESREIALHYDEDPDFRDHVNRYIHDFESMLRVILSARDGNALAVAVLSSDMGKLYVALAQAIERLRQ